MEAAIDELRRGRGDQLRFSSTVLTVEMTEIDDGS